MKRVSFIDGLWIALSASVSGGALFFALAPWLPVTVLFKWMVSLITFGYVAYLLIRAPRRSGWLSALTVWVWIAIAGGLLIRSVPLFITLHMTLIWLIRSLYFYHSPIAAFIDLALCGLSLGTAAWVYRQTGSLVLGIWCLFLIQALVFMIPADFKPTRDGGAERPFESDRFERAHRSAEWALRKLS